MNEDVRIALYSITLIIYLILGSQSWSVKEHRIFFSSLSLSLHFLLSLSSLCSFILSPCISWDLLIIIVSSLAREWTTARTLTQWTVFIIISLSCLWNDAGWIGCNKSVVRWTWYKNGATDQYSLHSLLPFIHSSLQAKEDYFLFPSFFLTFSLSLFLFQLTVILNISTSSNEQDFFT